MWYSSTKTYLHANQKSHWGTDQRNRILILSTKPETTNIFHQKWNKDMVLGSNSHFVYSESGQNLNLYRFTSLRNPGRIFIYVGNSPCAAVNQYTLPSQSSTNTESIWRNKAFVLPNKNCNWQMNYSEQHRSNKHHYRM